MWDIDDVWCTSLVSIAVDCVFGTMIITSYGQQQNGEETVGGEIRWQHAGLRAL